MSVLAEVTSAAFTEYLSNPFLFFGIRVCKRKEFQVEGYFVKVVEVALAKK